jgi:hypothetical protein
MRSRSTAFGRAGLARLPSEAGSGGAIPLCVTLAYCLSAHARASSGIFGA